MFCAKCGNDNPNNGKFCRGCGTALVTTAAAPALVSSAPVCNSGKPITWESLMTKFGTGFAFLVISIVLGTTGYAGGRNWWFWLLIPAFTMMGAGIAQYIQLKKHEAIGYVGGVSPQPLAPTQNASLPTSQTTWVSPESRYKTGDLVPRSVTDNTTRHLEMDTEGKTMTLPKP